MTKHIRNEMKGTHQLLVYSDVDLRNEDLKTVKIKAETQLHLSKEVCLEWTQRELNLCSCFVISNQGNTMI